MEEIKDRKAFNFYRSYWEVAQMLNNKNRLAFLDALLSRQFTGEEPTFNGAEQAKFAWVSQKHSIDSQIDGFINKKIAISKQGITPSIPPTEPPTELLWLIGCNLAILSNSINGMRRGSPIHCRYGGCSASLD